MRILSIGCGDGSLDLPMLEAARGCGPVQYVGCDVNAESLAVFSTALGRRDPDPDLAATLVHGPFQMLDDDRRFDVVLIAHVLYYVDDPAAAVRALLDERCALDGRIVVIHSGRQGVPAMVEAALGDASFVTAEQIAVDLEAVGLAPTTRVLPGRLRIDDAVADTPLGRVLLEFLVERAPLDEIDHRRLVAEMEVRSTTRDDGCWMPEDLVTMEIRNRLRPTAHRTDRIAVDPLEDYHVLAESFDWPERLASLPGDAALLDVGCGTGRWLRVLASTFPELIAPDRPVITYDRVDPSAVALDPNATVASTMFDLGRTWCEGIETVSLLNDHYALIWSVHSLYSLPVTELDSVLRRLVEALTVDGVLMVMLGDPGSFYLEAKPNLVGGGPFTSSADVLDAVRRLGLSVTVRTIDYVESFDATDEDAVRRYVWHESIGNSYLPAGLSGGELPALPTGEWWDAHLRGDRYEFAQSVSVILIERG